MRRVLLNGSMEGLSVQSREQGQVIYFLFPHLTNLQTTKQLKFSYMIEILTKTAYLSFPALPEMCIEELSDLAVHRAFCSMNSMKLVGPYKFQ